jgi:tetratricopeptide (TPR) repeat protein
LPDTLRYPARTNGDRFEIRTARGWEPFYVKGVNLGAALPGRFPSQFPDSSTYAGWIRAMAEMSANAVRVYTLHPPDFYRALYHWNTRSPDRTLWLIHGVWTELPRDHDFSAPAHENAFFAEMHDVVDALHGRADIESRPGHASGYYTADVSRWTLAWIVGREWEPASAVAFDSIRGGEGGFEGEYLTLRGGNAMDAWLARASEEIVAYETETYRAQRPVAYTNWPTLDPLAHPVDTSVDEEMAIRRARGERPEVRPREYDNDALSLDAMLVTPTERLPAGYFASYHAYPYYPDFMILQDEYADAASSPGRSAYLAYLRALKARHAGMPVVISEYGVPASIGNAHLQPEGRHHGGLTEARAAEVNRRMTLEIAEAGMAGGALFAWIDEWFKQNWVALEFELPASRNRLWYNRLDAEQHYGLLAVEAEPPLAGATLEERLAEWRRVEPLYGGQLGAREQAASGEPRPTGAAVIVRAVHDEAYLWLLVEGFGEGQQETPAVGAGDGAGGSGGPQPHDTLLVGFDVIRPDAGDFHWPGAAGERLPVGVEFVLIATGDEVRVMADPPSNAFRHVEVGRGASGLEGRRLEIANAPPGLFHARVEQRFNLPYYTVPNDDGRYDSLRVVINRRRFTQDSTEVLAVGYDRGVLPAGAAPDGLWERIAGALEIRIPWLLLNVTDPSSRSVLQGPGADHVLGAERGPDGRWRLRPGEAAWPDSVRGPFGTERVDDIGIVVALRRGGESVALPASGAAVARFTWPTWEEPEWVTRPRPAYRTMADTYARLDPYVSGPAARPPPDSTLQPPRGSATPPPPGSGSAQAANPQVDPADAAWAEGDLERALELYRQRLARDPADGTALHRLALMVAWEERYDESLERFDALLRVEPDNLDARVDRARVVAWSGDVGAALDALSDVLAEHPEYVRALEARAQLESWAGRYEESVATYEQVLAIAPDNEAARLRQAQVLSWASDFEASLAAYDSVLALDADDSDARLGRATALTFMGDLEPAIAAYDRVLVAEPRNVRALQGKARALGWDDDLVESERAWRSAVAVERSDATSYVGLGQVLRWQGRNAAALEVLREAEEADPTNGDVREQLRLVRTALAPAARPSFVAEDDSDGNRMLSALLSASWHPVPRLDIRADAYRRDLRQDALVRSARGLTVSASYLLEPGWDVLAGAGGSESDGTGRPSFAAYQVRVTSPGRYRYGFGVGLQSYGLDATAALAERGVRATELSLSGRWAPAPGWRLDGSAGRAMFEGTMENRRTSGFLSASRRAGRLLTVGLSARAFAFEQDLTDGYFDPDFYGIGELTGRWLYQPEPWSFLVELAPGVQKITSDGDPGATLRGSARLGFRIAPGRELSLSAGYSSTGLQSFSSGASDYRYTALIVGAGWVF